MQGYGIMWRIIGSIAAGLVSWFVIVTILNFGLRAGIPGYHAAEATLEFTSEMKAGRLIEAALTSLAAGAIVGTIAPRAKWASLVAGFIVLAMFLPFHIKIWDKFPAWYHLMFLVPILPLFALGAWFATRRGRAAA